MDWKEKGVEEMREEGIFFSSILVFFFNYYLRNESGEKFFSNLILLSHVNRATYKGVASIYLARLEVLIRERRPTWRHVSWDD
jgi:hypothetical protein